VKTARTEVPVREHKSVVVLCHVALDERNGGGMRTLLSYLSQLPDAAIHSVHFGDTANSGRHGLPVVSYMQLARRRFPMSIRGYISSLRQLQASLPNDPHFVLFPNTKDDVQLCLAATCVSGRTCVWLMDDFISTMYPTAPVRRHAFRAVFRQMYRRAGRRIAISTPMAREYAVRYGKQSDLVLGKRWHKGEIRGEPVRTRPVTMTDPLRVVWVGKYLPYYHEPIATFGRVLRANPDLPVVLDLYGQEPPFDGVVVPGRLEYRGPFNDATILTTLRAYDTALLTYSFDTHTRGFMRLSFPGKLTDYVSAGLPVLTVSPRDISVCDDIQNRIIGPCVFSPTRASCSARSARC